MGPHFTGRALHEQAWIRLSCSNDTSRAPQFVSGLEHYRAWQRRSHEAKPRNADQALVAPTVSALFSAIRGDPE